MNIVSLLPSSSEILGVLGLMKNVVAVSHECDFPAEALSKPRITSSIIPHGLEARAIDDAVVAAVQEGRPLYEVNGDLLGRLNPDLIVTQGVCDVCAVGVGTVEETLKLLPDVVSPNVETLSLTGTTVAGILRDILRVAQAAGVPERGVAVVRELQGRWDVLEATSKQANPRVLVLEWSDPPFSAGHWVPEMVAAAGGTDVLGEPGAVSRRLTWAEILQADPDLVVMAACGYGTEQNVLFARDLYAHPEARRLRAVRDGRVYAVDANAYFSRPGPRVVAGAELLARLFAGQATPEDAAQVAPVAVQNS